MTSPTLFDQTEPTVLAELENVINESMSKENESFDRGWNAALEMVLEEIALRKPTEIDQLKQAFAEGYIQTESAESWVKKFSQGRQVESDWIEFSTNKQLFNIEAKKNCLCRFDDGSIVRYNDKHPMAVLTHFKLAEQYPA